MLASIGNYQWDSSRTPSLFHKTAESKGVPEPIFLDIWDPNIDDLGQKNRACGAKKHDF